MLVGRKTNEPGRSEFLVWCDPEALRGLGLRVVLPRFGPEFSVSRDSLEFSGSAFRRKDLTFHVCQTGLCPKRVMHPSPGYLQRAAQAIGSEKGEVPRGNHGPNMSNR